MRRPTHPTRDRSCARLLLKLELPFAWRQWPLREPQCWRLALPSVPLAANLRAWQIA